MTPVERLERLLVVMIRTHGEDSEYANDVRAGIAEILRLKDEVDSLYRDAAGIR